MSRRDRRDGDRRPSERRDSQPDDEQQQRRPGEAEVQEGESLTALKAILAKVAGLLASLQLTQDESISLVEQLYGSVLDMDVKLAGETDDRRRSSVLAHIQNTSITRVSGKIVVDYPARQESRSEPTAVGGPEASPARPPATRPSAAPSAGLPPQEAQPGTGSAPEEGASIAEE